MHGLLAAAKKRVLLHSFPDLLAATRGHQINKREVIT